MTALARFKQQQQQQQQQQQRAIDEYRQNRLGGAAQPATDRSAAAESA